MPDILVLLQLAHLGIDMEYLFTASKRLNDDEIRIIEQYRSATIQSQFAIQGIMEIIEKKTPEEQKADEERYWQMMLYGNLNP